MNISSHRSGTGLILVALATLLTACGSSDDSKSTSSSAAAPATAADAKVAALVPEKFKSKGTLTVASDASYAPMESVAKDGKTVEGVDPDLAKALGEIMGVKLNVVNASFDSILPGLKSGKYDMGMSAFTDTKEREQTVDFVTYFSAGTSFYVKAEGGPDITGLDDLCGKKVAVEKGTTQAADVKTENKKCKSSGKPAISEAVFPDFNGVNLALSSGRADVAMGDSPVAAYQVKQSEGTFKLVGQDYGTAPFGIATPKGSGLEEAVLASVQKLMENGKYTEILKKWGVESSAISDPKVNGATS